MNYNELVEEAILEKLTKPMSNSEIADKLCNNPKINVKNLSFMKFKSNVISSAVKKLKEKDKIWTIGSVQTTKHMKFRDALNHMQKQIDDLHDRISKLEDAK